MNSCLYECSVLHARFSPRPHRFLYRIFLFALDLDELETLHRRLPFFSLHRANLYSFRDRDFLPTGEPLHHAAPASPAAPPQPSSLKARVVAHLATRGIDLTGGRVVLVTLPRVLGYLFNPVSFYFCYDRAGAPVAALAEVTNTFKEMKPYVLGPECLRFTTDKGAALAADPSTFNSQLSTDEARASGASFVLRTPKHFYVSPFSDVDVAFDFTLRTPGENLSIQIDDYVGSERTLTSTLAGPRRALTGPRLAWFTLKYPLLTLRIIGLIHWHAFLLWLKRVPWFSKSARPADQRALYRPHSSLAAPATRATPTVSVSTATLPSPALSHAQPSDAA